MARAGAAASRLRLTYAAGMLPVPVERIAQRMGATIVYEAMDRGVSGILVRDGP